MVQVSRRTGLTGSALIRLLARLADTDAPESKQSFADRLSHWLSWTDAISLSAALDGSPSTPPPGARASGSAEEGECKRVRTALVNAIATPMDTTTDFAPYRRRYLARQQAMEASIGPLRGRLRSRLAAGSPAMARLAAVDAVMEQVLGAHEQRLLATVPALLEKHFTRLRRADQATPPDEADAERQPGKWLDVFGKDMQGVLLAELDLRFQPLEGLLEALRSSQPKPP
ncbi:DUF3348 domain-containing protein [Variovorax sp. M-6]|uniref:DUF3348 domain-containing protein n=1 Tax=Variovorax sp. M-6 TaxID=3233041 RepID=UPI003F9CE61A